MHFAPEIGKDLDPTLVVAGEWSHWRNVQSIPFLIHPATELGILMQSSMAIATNANAQKTELAQRILGRPKIGISIRPLNQVYIYLMTPTWPFSQYYFLYKFVNCLAFVSQLGNFLATGGKSCTEACTVKGLICDIDVIRHVASDFSICKETLKVLRATAEREGTFPDDNSGCTYHPGGTGFYQLMNNGKPTTCDVKNSDGSRQRVCSCKGEIPGHQYR